MKFHANDSEFFWRLRDLRVNIEHRGNQFPPIFELEDGLAVPVTDHALSELGIWERKDLKIENRFESLLDIYGI